MYGLVNQAIEDLAVQLAGEAGWRRIKAEDGVDVEVFVGMEPYDDDITYRFVTAASDVLGLPTEVVLEAFGKHWIRYTGRQGYGTIFTMMGSTLPVFLHNLDAMHARISLSMLRLRPPSFACEELDDTRLVVRYWSKRNGLAPMVKGLLSGLGEYFGLDVTVVHTCSRADGEDHDEFLVTYVPVAPPTGYLAGEDDGRSVDSGRSVGSGG